MNRGLYTSASAMLVGLLRQETVSHNLANVQTIGFKADRVTTQDFPSLLLSRLNDGPPNPEVGRAGTGVTLGALSTDFSIGPMKLTENPLDFAIAGDGFFQVQTEDGIRYTRDGTFDRDLNGNLVTNQGYRVLGPNGPITLPAGDMTVNQNGQIFVNGEYITDLSISRFDDPAGLEKDGETLFNAPNQPPQQVAVGEVRVYQGYLENSNVDTALVITEMMSVNRAYQASQRMVQFQDRINDRAANELGRV